VRVDGALREIVAAGMGQLGARGGVGVVAVDAAGASRNALALGPLVCRVRRPREVAVAVGANAAHGEGLSWHGDDDDT